MKNKRLGSRLLSVSSMVRRGAVLADIGTDHAYLPIYLLKQGIISRAVCSDINEGPLASARENLIEEGLLGSAELVLTSGAAALSDRGITDYAVCGMGGELIADIIGAAPAMRGRGVRLILQPMTKHECLRAYLAAEGFRVLEEKYSCDEGKYYTALSAEFLAEPRAITEYEAYFGAGTEGDITDSARLGYINARASALKKIILGKRGAGVDFSAEQALLDELYEKTKIIPLKELL